jgi:hypothetical protein
VVKLGGGVVEKNLNCLNKCILVDEAGFNINIKQAFASLIKN